jgi:hypothetical protein
MPSDGCFQRQDPPLHPDLRATFKKLPYSLKGSTAMFLLTVIVAACNLALGYALAIWLGWATLPELGKKASAAAAPAETHGH